MEQKTIKLPESNLGAIRVEIEGISPLIVHRFDEKVKKMMVEKRQSKAKVAEEIITPEEETRRCLYFLEDGKSYGFPAVAFKASMVRAGQALNYKMTQLKAQIFVAPHEGELVEIVGKPTMRCDIVANGGNKSKSIPRHRPEFVSWKTTLLIQFTKETFDYNSILQLLQDAGYAVGVGDWRPERNGVCGRWTVKKAYPVEIKDLFK